MIVPFRSNWPSRVGSSKTRAAINDGYVAALPPSLTEAMNFYELLGILETGTLGEIKQAYKQLARKYHPDVSPPGLVEEYTQKFIQVQEAYETLSNPGRRALCDEDMAKGLHFAFSARKRYKTDEIRVKHMISQGVVEQSSFSSGYSTRASITNLGRILETNTLNLLRTVLRISFSIDVNIIGIILYIYSLL